MIPGLVRSAGERIGYPLQYFWASLVAQLVENLSAMWETWVFLLHMKTFYKLVVLLLQNHLLLMYVYVCVCADVCVCVCARTRAYSEEQYSCFPFSKPAPREISTLQRH